jgi:hypothetical protein
MGLVPDAEEAPEEDEFAEVVGVVVGDEEGFAEQVLAGAPEEWLVEVDVRLQEELLELVLVGADLGDVLFQASGVGGAGELGQ